MIEQDKNNKIAKVTMSPQQGDECFYLLQVDGYCASCDASVH